MGVLEKVNLPEDLKTLSLRELEALCGELREEIVRVVSKNGGHLAPSLGAVELCVSLLKVFSPPRDVIIFDVGHQSYAYKLLTGRKDRFHTLRQRGGIAGFNRLGESEYDFLTVGHSSTSISAALGYAVGFKLRGEHNRKAVAVIGDGALTSGVAWEGLNNLGTSRANVLVVLNDNGMSISPNTGSLSKYLFKFREALFFAEKPFVKKWEQIRFSKKLSDRLLYLPLEGGRRLKRVLKFLFLPRYFFEELGLKYYGPVNGNSVRDLVEFLKIVKPINEPVLLHVVTKKGKGFPPAEREPEKFHGVGPFSYDGKRVIFERREEGKSFSEVFARSVIEAAESDERIVAITAAMAKGTKLELFREKFPDRFFDVGIAESHALLFATGLALSGMKPVAAIYSTFLQRAYDQIVHDIGIMNVPVLVGVDRSGLVGEDGETHHGAFDLPMLLPVPKVTVISPATAEELEWAVSHHLSNLSGPVFIRYPRERAVSFPEDSVGKVRFLKEGRDTVAVSTSTLSLKLARIPGEHAVLHVPVLKPLPEEELKLMLRKGDFKRVVIVDESPALLGFAKYIYPVVKEALPEAEVRIKGLPDEYVSHGKREELLEDMELLKL